MPPAAEGNDGVASSYAPGRQTALLPTCGRHRRSYGNTAIRVWGTPWRPKD